jgi:5'(3')-deoxyribonucleotidase
MINKKEVIDQHLQNMTIAFDLDAVLTHTFVEEWLKQYHQYGGECVNINTLDSYEFSERVENPELLFNLVTCPLLSKWVIDLPITENAVTTLKWLNKNSNIYIVSATPLTSVENKVKWIHNNLPFIDDDQIVFMKDKYRFDADILIDDSADNVLEFVDFGMKIGKERHGILYTQPWNAYMYDDYLDGQVSSVMSDGSLETCEQFHFVDKFSSEADIENFEIDVASDGDLYDEKEDTIICSIRRIIYEKLLRLSIHGINWEYESKDVAEGENGILH